jgi:hypothetical protein
MGNVAWLVVVHVFCLALAQGMRRPFPQRLLASAYWNDHNAGLYVSIYAYYNLEAFDAGAQELQPNRTTLLEPLKVRRMSRVLICG